MESYESKLKKFSSLPKTGSVEGGERLILCRDYFTTDWMMKDTEKKATARVQLYHSYMGESKQLNTMISL
jgi:hypothetical protein